MRVPSRTSLFTLAVGVFGMGDYNSAPYFILSNESWQTHDLEGPSWWKYHSDSERDTCAQYGYGNMGPIRFKFLPPGTKAQRNCYRFSVLFFDDEKIGPEKWLGNNLCNRITDTNDAQGNTIELGIPYYSATTTQDGQYSPLGLVDNTDRPRLCNCLLYTSPSPRD